MAYNSSLYFPQSYQPYNPGYQQMPQVSQQQQMQMMTPPTIHADIVQVDGEEAASAYPVGAGSSQMMIAKDDSAIYVKTASANGQASLDVFVKRPPAPKEPAFDPSVYVRKDEIESIVRKAIEANGKKEADNESF